MREVEMKANISSWCGRTELNGTVDIDSNTEQALADGRVAKVTSGSTLTVTVHQVNQDGKSKKKKYVRSIKTEQVFHFYNEMHIELLLRVIEFCRGSYSNFWLFGEIFILQKGGQKY